MKDSTLTASLLDQPIIRRLQQRLDSVREAELELALPLSLPPVRHSGRPGGPRHDDSHYLPWAVNYAQLVADGERHPIKILAAQVQRSTNHVRDQIHKCRVRGLLTPSERGRVEGRLTEKALELWDKDQRQGEPPQ